MREEGVVDLHKVALGHHFIERGLDVLSVEHLGEGLEGDIDWDLDDLDGSVTDELRVPSCVLDVEGELVDRLDLVEGAIDGGCTGGGGFESCHSLNMIYQDDISILKVMLREQLNHSSFSGSDTLDHDLLALLPVLVVDHEVIPPVIDYSAVHSFH
jgi:hypothetical protein